MICRIQLFPILHNLSQKFFMNPANHGDFEYTIQKTPLHNFSLCIIHNAECEILHEDSLVYKIVTRFNEFTLHAKTLSLYQVNI